MGNKTEASLKKMDAIKDLDFKMDVDIAQIILKAEMITNKKKDKKEFILFILSAFSLVAFVLFFIILTGAQKIILYFEGAFFTLAPLMIIAAALSARVRED